MRMALHVEVVHEIRFIRGFYMFRSVVLPGLIVAAFAGSLSAQDVIAAQSFESPQSANAVFTATDQLNFIDPTTGEITGGTSHVFDGDGLGWTLFWENSFGLTAFTTRSGLDGTVAGPLTSVDGSADAIGVETSGDFEDDFDISSGLDGSRAFLAEDVDGTLSIVFDAIDASLYQSLELSFRIVSRGSDVDLLVNGTDLSGQLGEIEVENGSGDPAFVSKIIDLSAFDGSGTLEIEFAITNQGSNDFVGLDAIEVSGVLIPAPSAACLALAGIATGLRRRRGA